MASHPGRFRSLLVFAARAFVAGAVMVGATMVASSGVWADADADRILQIPGLPPIHMPPGVHVYGPGQYPGGDAGRGVPAYPNGGPGAYGGTVIGPGGVVKPFQPPTRAEAPKKKPPTAAERAEAIRKALMPHPPLATARRRTLDDLYVKLAAASDEDEAKGLATLIGNIWMRSGSDTANLLMQRAVQSIEHKDYALAETMLDQVIQLQPGWAEAWNKRASARFLAGDLNGSMKDVEHVLKLEPKHFGALEGMGMILQRTGFDKQALEIYRRALAVYPHQTDIQKIVDKLTLDVEGQGI